jgi:hypothetical protein
MLFKLYYDFISVVRPDNEFKFVLDVPEQYLFPTVLYG